MIISIASGKGGTGKTTVSTSLALSWGKVRFLDCDVEEPNAHIFIKPEINHREVVEVPIPEVDKSRCSFCGKCADFCEFNAIVVVKDKIIFFPELCHGCGGCQYVCPENAVSEIGKEIGVLESGQAGSLSFTHGVLKVGEPMAPPLIRRVKKSTSGEEDVIIDASPGTSCPVVEAVKGSDFCLLVTEPTPFGLHDLKLAVGMLDTLSIPHGVIINCAGIGNNEVEHYCEREGITVYMTIPWDRKIAEAYSRGIPLVEVFPEYREKFLDLKEKIRKAIA